jgi:hypothetical protein
MVDRSFSATLPLAGSRFSVNTESLAKVRYPRLLHLAHGIQRPLQFAFQSPAVVDVLHEIGRAELSLVEQLEADAPRFGQAGGGHLQTRLGQYSIGH